MPKRFLVAVLFIVFVSLALTLLVCFTFKKYTPVIEVIDGDTIKVLVDNKIETVRFIGIDAPEMGVCFSTKSAQFVHQLLDNKEITLKRDPTQSTRDKYDRWLYYIYLKDGTNLNALMVSEGYACEYTYITPYEYQKNFKQLQQSAKENKKGLWSYCP